MPKKKKGRKKKGGGGAGAGGSDASGQEFSTATGWATANRKERAAKQLQAAQAPGEPAPEREGNAATEQPSAARPTGELGKQLGSCTVCGELAPKRCPRCDAPYCSRECQQADWKAHKKVCAGLKKKKREGMKSLLEGGGGSGGKRGEDDGIPDCGVFADSETEDAMLAPVLAAAASLGSGYTTGMAGRAAPYPFYTAEAKAAATAAAEEALAQKEEECRQKTAAAEKAQAVLRAAKAGEAAMAERLRYSEQCTADLEALEAALKDGGPAVPVPEDAESFGGRAAGDARKAMHEAEVAAAALQSSERRLQQALGEGEVQGPGSEVPQEEPEEGGEVMVAGKYDGAGKDGVVEGENELLCLAVSQAEVAKVQAKYYDDCGQPMFTTEQL